MSDPITLSNHNQQPTTPENRNMNTKFKRKKDKWRADYAHVCECIRYFKADIKRIPERKAVIMLRSLQDTARTMMEDRKTIGEVLRVTAYPYV